MILYTVPFLLANILISYGAQPEVRCPVPISPTNGQVFVTKLGTSVKFSCNPGYELIGSQVAICKENYWYPETPSCKPIEQNKDSNEIDDAAMPISSSRPLFKWDSNEIDDKENDTMLQDARYHMVLYPRNRVMSSSVRVRTASQIEEEEKRRLAEERRQLAEERRQLAAANKEKQRPTTSPRVVYVRRSWPYYQQTPHQVVVDSEGNEIVDTNDKAYQYYWDTRYPRRQLVRYDSDRQPVVGLSLSESQIAWINSLHPELRDRYLKDLYEVRANDVGGYYVYNDGYRWVNRNPYYTRQPVSVVAENTESNFDYSCHRTERDGRVVTIRAPKLSNGYIHRYDRRKNSYHPYNDYLVAQYRCKAGYTLFNPNVNELFCSRSSWVGNPPVCVPKA